MLTEDDAENWTRAVTLMETVGDLELVGPSLPPTDLLHRLFHEETPRVYDAQSVKFEIRNASCRESV